MAEPLCPYFGACGGCSSQHVAYDSQLEWKRKKVVAVTGQDKVAVFHGQQYGYRNRMDFLMGGGAFGLRRKGKVGIIDVERCPISQDAINELLKEIREVLSGVDSKSILSIIIRPSCVVFVLDGNSSRLAPVMELIKIFAAKTSCANVVVSYPGESAFAVKGDNVLSHSILGKNFLFPADGFFQNNSVVAEKMHAYCRQLLAAHKTDAASLLDLYGGVGCFGLINADLFKQALIVEEVAASIECAQKNIEVHGVKNAKAMALDAKRIGRLTPLKPLFVIADPPRSGMDPKTIDALNAFQPEAIIYISCNVEQLAKDLPKFKNYEIKSAAIFDLFPNTPHIEAVVELIRK